MARLTNELVELVTDRVGKCNTDIISGWETGLKGKRRVGGKLFDRYAPDHLIGQRYSDWLRGYEGGLEYRGARFLRTSFHGTGPDGPMVVERKGWVYARGAVITQMERKGAYGTVTVFYTERGTIKRTVECGI